MIPRERKVLYWVNRDIKARRVFLGSTRPFIVFNLFIIIPRTSRRSSPSYFSTQILSDKQ